MEERTNDSEDVRVGANLARMRTARSLSQAELAQKVGVAQQTIAKIEKGTRSLKYIEALRICRALELPMALLSQEDRRAANTATLIAHTTEMSALARELRDFSGRLAPALAQLAFSVAYAEALSDADRPAQIEYDKAASWLDTNWGEELNNQVLRALPTDNESRSINPDVDVDTYRKGLARIARLKVEIYDPEA